MQPGAATSLISLQKESNAGIPRCPYMMPPMQRVSPTHWSIPYFNGISTSVAKASNMPILTQLITYLASLNASLRSRDAWILMFRPFSSISLWHSCVTMRRLSGLMSVNATSISWNSGTDRRSVSRPLVKPMLPAPINATLNDIKLPSLCKILIVHFLPALWYAQIAMNRISRLCF